MAQPTPVQQIMVRWRKDPVAFVREAIGASPSNQQEDGLRRVGELVRSKYKAFAGFKLTRAEVEMSKKIGITIRSGQGPGKDAWLAWVHWWFFYCYNEGDKEMRGLVTAPTKRQLETVFWPELGAWARKSRADIGRFFEIQNEKVFLKEDPKRCFVTAKTAAAGSSEEEQGETVRGLHAPYMLIAVDEASGVANGVFRPLEGTLTSAVNFAILIGNMTRSSGYFFDSHFNPRVSPYWITLHWDSEKSNLDEVTNGLSKLSLAIERAAAKYGRDSNFFRINVKGEPPTADPDSLIPYDWVRDAVDRDLEADNDAPLIAGLDVARQGDDKSVLLFRRGHVVEDIVEYKKIADTMELVGWVMEEIQTRDTAALFIDVIGVGYGVFDRFRELNPMADGRRIQVHGVNVSESASRDDRFIRLRDQLWWRVREQFENRTIKIPDDNELIGELSSIKYRPESDSRIKVEGKPEMKKRGLSSPNKADALCLTYYHRDSMFAREKEPADKYRRKAAEMPESRSWMTA